MLVLHEELFGPDLLIFMSMDEKPFWFNAIGGAKIWARRGAKKKHVREKRQDMLERWTGMSACYSKELPLGMVPRWAALFRAEDGSRTRIEVPDGVKVQFAPHGSYRMITWVGR